MIDKTAVIEEGAALGRDVKIGPYCVVGKNVRLGDRVELVSHVVVDGKTSVGDDAVVYPFAAIGVKGQDLKFQDDSEMTGVEIGKRCKIREYATIQSGTPASKGTKIGDDCQIMVNAHIAHDCQLGNNIVLSNLVQLAGHVEIEDFAIISAMSAVHQFCHVGCYAFLGAMSGTPVDIPPYVIYEGLPARYRTINKVGLARHGFTNDDMHAIHMVYSSILGNEPGELADKIAKLRKQVKDNQHAMNALDFIENRSGRGITAGAKLNYT
ncbi:MAG: acyl-ACP--UDP-N-acetylglucosamine O-acyltransferase [Rickettsiales bacterium]|jgi:UDP-N-acetylglucosamine acyltransferase|nr:acyl-ACP--UDP-N-acetylglucosamine O-acyltransferase [Rickettsiales bacterium]